MIALRYGTRGTDLTEADRRGSGGQGESWEDADTRIHNYSQTVGINFKRSVI